MVRYLTPVPRRRATGLVARVYEHMERHFGGVLEPFTLHSPVPELLAGAWCALYETLVAGEGRREVKEAVATAVSRLNRCPYCVDAHTSMLYAAGAGAAARALRREREAELEDEELRALAAWAAASRSPGAEILRRPPFPPERRPAMIGTALCFHYINRLATVLLGETPLPVRSPPLKAVVLRFSRLFFGDALRARHEPGASLELLPPARLPADLPWAAPSPTVGGAFARWAAAAESASEEVLPAPAKAALARHLEAWEGEEMPFGTAWLDEALAEAGKLAPRHRAALRLALLTALAPYRADEGEVRRFRAHWPEDGQLLAALTWGGYAAARRVGSWLG